MKKILLLLLMAAIAVSLFLLPPRYSHSERIMKDMDLKDKAAQLLMPGFLYESYKSPDDYKILKQPTVALKRLLEEYNFAGVLLYAGNMQDHEQTRALTSGLQEIAAENGQIPFLIACDQEGGAIAKIGFGPRMPGNMALGAIGDPEAARQTAMHIALQMQDAGINCDLAPVLDINNEPANPIIGIRSFSDDPGLTGELGTAFLNGARDQGLIMAAKHFPGHGNTAVDSHHALPLSHQPKEELLSFELQPFIKAISADVPLIMSAHIACPALDDTLYRTAEGEDVYLPATLSKKIINDLLREELGYDGVVISDALDMAAISGSFRKEDVAALAINAGVDILLVPVSDMQDTGSYYQELKDYVAMIVKLVEDGIISEERIDEAVSRIIRLKEDYGLFDQDKEQESYDEQAALTLEKDLAVKAITIVKGKELLPLSQDDRLLVLTDGDRQSRIAEEVLKDKDITYKLTDYSAMTLRKDKKKIPELFKDTDKVIVISRMNEMNDLGSEAAVWLDETLTQAHKKDLPVFLISSHLPYDLARFEADGLLACYGSFTPNLDAALEALYDPNGAKGHLPVNIPALDKTAAGYRFSQEILYPRGE